MVKFLFVRVFALAAALAAGAFVLSGYNVLVPAGILLGGLISVYKFRLLFVFLSYFIKSGKKVFLNSFLTNLFLQMVMFVTLAVAAKLNAHFFYSFAAGLFLTSAVIYIYGLMGKLKEFIK